jgi:molecular chaperone GrpE
MTDRPGWTPGPRDPASGPGDPSAGRPGYAGERSGGSVPGPDAGGAPDAPLTENLDEVADDVADTEAPAAAPEDPIAMAERQRDEFRDALVRLQADFENYRKRIIKQQTEHLERAAESLVEKLLPVLDTAELAMAHGGGEDVKQITAALLGTLEREGLERIDPNGGAFDPTLHDAVVHEPGEGHEQEVAEVLRVGYRWKGRVLRPAMVKVRG